MLHGSVKILIIGNASSSHIPRWVEGLSKRNLNIELGSIHEARGSWNTRVSKHRLSYKKPFGYITNIQSLKRLILEIQPDIIHSFYALGYGTLGSLSGFKPHVLSVMGSDIYDDIKNPLLKPFVVKNIRNADVVCSTSLTMARQIEKVTGLEHSQIKHTPFGIDINKFKPGSGQERKEEIVFGTVKFLEDKYGIDVLLKAYALFKTNNPDTPSTLIIVGDGSKENDLKTLASQLNIYQDCNFMGYQPHANIPAILQSFDVYLALSRYDSESFGVAILEASATGLPVIVSDVGGLPEVVVDQETGLIVESESTEQTAAAMKTLAKDTDLRLNLGNNGRKRVEKWYNWEHSVDKMISIYDRIISTSSKE